jgi:phage tail-like protein
MKTSRIPVISVLVLVMILPRAKVVEAAETGTAFTYQGRLEAHGSPAEGLYDLTFVLFDSPEKGRPIGSPEFRGEVEITGGYFMVELDFGADPSVFNGLTRYLEIAVKRSGSREPTILLAPRQKINPSPYANRAFSAQQLTALKFIPEYVVRMDIVGKESQYFHYFNRLKSETKIIEYREGTGTGVMKLPGESGAADLEIRRFASQNSFLRAWMSSIREGGSYQRNPKLFLLDRSGRAVDGWELINAWPCRLFYETDGNLGTVVETGVIVAERIRRLPIDPVGQELDRWYPGQQPVVQLPLKVEVTEQGVKTYDEMAAIGWDVQVIEYRFGEDQYVHKLAGEVVAMNANLGRGVTNGDTDVMQWRWNIVNGIYDKRNVHIFMQDKYNEPVFGVVLADAWPAELSTSYDWAKKRMEETLLVATDSVQW